METNSIILNSGISQDILNHMKTTNQESQMEFKFLPSVSQAKALNSLAQAHGIETNDDLIREAEKAEKLTKMSNDIHDTFSGGRE
jgi:hypothetical protein